ncbi:MAG: GspH/FimT family pseudopilin [Pseudomonadota bacterium]|nr:GspH/FimT family pseudopilin [Pseudomonadota bacterium]
MNRNGFTVIELMIVLSVLAIISATALPSFKNTLTQLEIDGQIDELVSMIYRARSEAIKRNRVVTVCKSIDKNSCGGTWSDGWIVFEDKNADGEKDADETKISVGKIQGNYKLKLSAFGSQTYIRFLQNGLTSFHNGTFTLCPKNGSRKLARAVIFSKTARVRASKDSNNNGIDEGSSGADLEC